MASTNKTTNYELSQYIGTDKPTYLSDYNGDMLKIDTGMKTNADNIATAVSSIESVTTVANQANATANTASSNASSALSTASEASTTAGNAQSTANSALSTATTAQSTANSNASKIGDLTNLETVSKTDLVSAINELIDDESESTTEIRTSGTWINGKPIYRKVLSEITISSTSFGTDVSNMDIDEMISIQEYYYEIVGSDYNETFGNYYSSSTDYRRSFFRTLNNGASKSIEYRGNNSGKVRYIITYTKTTDTPAS